MRARWLVILPIYGLACALSAIAAGDPRGTIDASRALDAGAPAALLPEIAITSTPPDPPPLAERSQWVFDLRWDRGDLWLLGSYPIELPAPLTTPRAMGRFALELFEGRALIERVRFDFPLLGAFEADGGPSFSQKLRTRIGVRFPSTKRGTRLELCDRATGRRWALPWPPQAPGPSASDGGPSGSSTGDGRSDSAQPNPERSSGTSY